MSPNTAIAIKAEDAASVGKAGCLHCGRALNSHSAGGAAHEQELYCCSGCRQVHRYLKENGLERYYELAASLDARPPTQARADGEAPDTVGRHYVWGAGENQCAFFVPDLSCAACLWLVERALTGEPDGVVRSLRVDLDAKMLYVVPTGSAEAAAPDVIRRLARLGYRALPPRLAQSDAFRTAQARRRLIDLGIAGATFGNVMLFATAVYFGDVWGMDRGMERLFAYLSLGLATLALATAGRSFFRNAWVAVRGRVLHIDLPIALALLLSYGVSVANLARGAGGVYFDSVTGLIFLLLVARNASESLQARARRLAGAAASLVPSAGASLRPGDEAVIKVGDMVPADGVVLAGASEVAEAALTGEPVPVLKGVGDRVFAGTHNLLGALRIRVMESGEDCYVARIARLVEEAGRRRSPVETAAEGWLRWFVAGIFAAAALAAVVWAGRDPSRVVEVVCATLIVSCPCALALATPLTMAAALKRAWQHGVIVKSAEALEAIAKVDTIVLDKTGTLTTGRVRVVRSGGMLPSPRDRRALRVAAEQSRHPVAKAIAAYLAATPGGARQAGEEGEEIEVEACEEIAGKGLVARLVLRAGPQGEAERVRVAVGSAAMAGVEARPGRQLAFAVLEGSGGERSLLEFELEDPLSPDAAAVVRGWMASGIDVRIASGDSPFAVERVREQCGVPVDKARSGQMPGDKARLVRDLVASGRHVLMVGDGVNDAEALAAATAGVAVAAGVDLALGSADAFLARSGLAPVAELREFARYTARSLRLILGANVSYNVVAVSLAISGVLHPFVAAAIMPLASLTVISISALRRGDRLWKSSTSSCPLPSPSPVSRSPAMFGASGVGSSTT